MRRKLNALVILQGYLLLAGRDSPPLSVRYIGVIDCDGLAEWHGDVFLACHSAGDQLPTPIDHSKHSSADAYVIRLDPKNRKLVYAVRLGGNQYSAAFGIKVDKGGLAYVIGSTQAQDFPTTPNAIQRKFGGGKSDAFLAIVSPDGKLRYSTFLGGSSEDDGITLESGAGGQIFLGGTTRSPDFPGANRSLDFHHSAAFVTRIDIQARKLTSLTLGGNGDTWLSGLRADRRSGMYAVGITHASNFPTLHALQTGLRGDSDAFLSRLDTKRLRLNFSTYFGGSGDDAAWGVAITDDEDPVVVGVTTSSDLPTTDHSFQKSLRGGKDAFLARFRLRNPNRVDVTYFGGTQDDAAGMECHGCSGAAVSADASSVWIGGTTNSSDLPVKNSLEAPRAAGAQQGFIAALSPSLASLCFSSYVGGNNGAAVEAIILSGHGDLLATGLSYSTNLEHAFVDTNSSVSLHLNGKSAHAMLISADVRGLCR